jgi:HAD superfamily hydrolase (TIGR01490 family)
VSDAHEEERPRAAAFFDLDKTLMQGSSAFQFARAAREAGLVTRRQLLTDAAANVRYRLRGASDAQSEALRDRIAASLEGVRVRDLERLRVPIVARILPRLYPRMLQVAYDHQDAGRPAYIVTAAAQELADSLANVLAFDGAIGSHLSETVDGVYTGKATGAFIYREAKAQAVRELAAASGIDLAASYAYSDSISDLPMLEAVGHAIVVNPDAELTRIARGNGWQIIRLDRLRVGLTALGATAVAAVAGGVTAAVLVGRRRST